MIMKVFINERKGDYAGGLAIVAANNAEEAHKVFCFNYIFSDFFDAKGKHCKKENAVSYSCPDYDADTWEEIPYLTANVAEPRFIKEDSYDR